MDDELLDRVREITASEPDAVRTARTRAGRSADLPVPEVGSLLAWLAAGAAGPGVQAAVEVGAASGVTGSWLVPTLAPKGVLTSIERDPHVHGLAAEAFEALGFGTRVRAILGDPDEVLPRLSDALYDLVLLQGSAFAGVDPLEHARRLLRPGGLLVARRVLAVGEHPEARARFVAALGDDPSFTVTVLPLDDGLVLATRRDDTEDEAPS